MDTQAALERSLLRGFSRWQRAKTPRGRQHASLLIEDSLANLEVMLGQDQQLRRLIRYGRLDINTVEQWLDEVVGP